MPHLLHLGFSLKKSQRKCIFCTYKKLEFIFQAAAGQALCRREGTHHETVQSSFVCVLDWQIIAFLVEEIFVDFNVFLSDHADWCSKSLLPRN